MKHLLVLALCFTLAMMVMANSEGHSKACKVDDDCDVGQCCVRYLFRAKCEDLLDEQQPCDVIKFKGLTSHNLRCPCKAGLECVATKEFEIYGIKIPQDPKCIKPEETEIAEE